ncbi:hypothetical protein GCM10010347_65050 [Streptomyces cirratus]|uniref:Uncharacterized protein n=1 Tax=Streptomyces cirratus TaxID=68187 RepID=A0ABQ3F5D9_9ACTN|nr:hypothetical protein [Streptomyces cirratus]GHB85076.1 hypothetical protein GCM10010347_65050 [Streptomyces cirratus]
MPTRSAEELTARGWSVNAWGQGVLTQPIQAALRKTDSSLRWTPDLLAARDDHLAMIDCKSSMTSRSTRRHAIERAAVRSHFHLVAWTELPIYYVFDNLDVLTPYDALTAGQAGPHSISGSGAPYLLVPVTLCRAFDSTFGLPKRPPVASDAA